ncbi:hypothetical protein GCM10009731_04400 [Streptomyces globosus]
MKTDTEGRQRFHGTMTFAPGEDGPVAEGACEDELAAGKRFPGFIGWHARTAHATVTLSAEDDGVRHRLRPGAGRGRRG